MSKLIIEANRSGYGTEQCGKTMTVAELIEYLQEEFNEEDRIYFSHDNGYTYGSLRIGDMREVEEDED